MCLSIFVVSTMQVSWHSWLLEPSVYPVSHLMFLHVCMSLSKYMSAGVHLQLDLVRPCFVKSYPKNIRLEHRIKWWLFGEVYSSAQGFCCVIAVSLVLIGYVSRATVDTETVPCYGDFICKIHVLFIIYNHVLAWPNPAVLSSHSDRLLHWFTHLTFCTYWYFTLILKASTKPIWKTPTGKHGRLWNVVLWRVYKGKGFFTVVVEYGFVNGLQREGILSESDGKCLKQKLRLKAHIKSLQVLRREQNEDRKSRTNEFRTP